MGADNTCAWRADCRKLFIQSGYDLAVKFIDVVKRDRDWSHKDTHFKEFVAFALKYAQLRGSRRSRAIH